MPLYWSCNQMDELDVTSSDKQYPGCYFLVCRGIEAGKSGIEGILSRLEKQRNRSFGLDLDNVSFENNLALKYVCLI